LAKKLALHLFADWGSGGLFENWQALLGEAHALWQGNAEPIEENGLSRVWLSHTAQAHLAMRRGWQDDVLGLNAFEFFRDGPWRIAETCAAPRRLR